jgi:adenine-specific DNA-methyltransferase
MAPKKTTNGGKSKRVTRYTYEKVMEPRTPETGHTALLPADEQVVTVSMDNGWTKAMKVSELPDSDHRPIVVDMDPAADPTLFWSGKRNRREVPILPLQRSEIVSESRIAQIIERTRKAAIEKSPQLTFGSIFADLEKSFRESDKSKRVEFYTHDEGWKNKLICGDSLYVMESLMHYEALRGKVQMIYLDPPYGIKYDSNFQQRVDSTKNDQNDTADDILTIKAFRDTWTLGIHSYLSYLQERLYLSRELLADSGSMFVQIGSGNVHLVRTLMDEVFGQASFVSQIAFVRAAGRSSGVIDDVYDVLLWYCKEPDQLHPSKLYRPRTSDELLDFDFVETEKGEYVQLTAEQLTGEAAPPSGRRFMFMDLTSQGESETGSYEVAFEGGPYRPRKGRHWSTTPDGMKRLIKIRRVGRKGQNIFFKRYADDFPLRTLWNIWDDTVVSGFMRSHETHYVVQTPTKVLERCITMSTKPGDLVFDPTCGGGTTAYIAEQLGRRWITCDTSRVAVNVTRKRLLSGVYPHFKTTNGKVSSGFVCKKISRVTLRTLAYDKEPESVELVDQPEAEKESIRVVGPFEVMSVGRYSVEDWKGFVATRQDGEIETPKLENYIGVICRLYRKDAAVQGAGGFVHAVCESQKEKIALSVGPLSGRVTAKQVNDAVQDALASGILEIHVLGWAFEANVGEVKAQLEKRGKVKVILQVIRPDTLSEGLKITKPETLFSPLALPDIEVTVKKTGKELGVVVHLKGVAVFDRKNRTTDYKHFDSGYISAWYLDEDYDGDCFVDCQMFFDFKKALNTRAIAIEVEPEEFTLQAESQSFLVRGYKRIAVKVVDIFGNESTVVRDL